MSDDTDPSEDGPADDLFDGIDGDDTSDDSQNDETPNAAPYDVPDDVSGEDDPEEREGPLGDLAARVDEDRETLNHVEEAFEEIDTGDVEFEDVWEELESGPAPSGEVVDASEDVRRIEKSVCHNCPHFGDPPELHCTHEGTTIREMPDDEHFVVVECPIVGDAGGDS